MTTLRPTFHESWHRVADLKPRLRSSVSVSRQLFRGQLWYVIQDQANHVVNHRLDAAGYHFLGLLDGKRTVRGAWDICNRSGDEDALTQGEVIELLGRLATANLLESDISPDAQAMFERYRKRKQRDMQSRLMNLLFPRIKLFDPDMILERGIVLVGWIFSIPGLLIWTAIIAMGAYVLLNSGPMLGTLLTESTDLLRPDNWLMLLLAFIVDKAVHESGHAIACKKFGRQSGTGGEVHTIGLMLLVFTPVPYVDTSSAWLIASKWRKAIIGAAGMWMEFALAAVAAIVWRYSDPGSTLHAFCYNLMFIASVTTVLFNGNPFLRYDGYYILADVLEIPNLLGRALQYATYLIRRYLFGVKQAQDPSETVGQRIWLVIYLILSGIVRVLVCTGIILFLVANLKNYPQLTILLVGMAMIAAATWLLVPIGRCVWYLLTSPELLHRRARAFIVSSLLVAMIVGAVGIWPLPHHLKVEGIVEPVHKVHVYAQSGGFLKWYHPSSAPGREVPAGTVLARLSNPRLLERYTVDQLRLTQADIKYRKALGKHPTLARVYQVQIRALKSEVARLANRVKESTIRAPVSGIWVTNGLRQAIGEYVPRGESIGRMGDITHMVIFAPATQQDAGRVIRSSTSKVSLRLPGEPAHPLPGVIRQIYPGGENHLPSAALSYLSGGPFAPDLHARTANQSKHPFFLLVIRPENARRLYCGQRIVARIRLNHQPLVLDIINYLRRTLQPGTGI